MKNKHCAWVGKSIIFLTLIGVGAFFVASGKPVDAATYTCRADGRFTSPASGPAALTSGDVSRANQALSWIASMAKTRTTVTTNSTITPATDWPDNHTDPVYGTFTLSGATYPTVDQSVLQVNSPSVVADTYRGVITGQVLIAPSPGRWIIQAYKRSSTGTSQVAVQALANGTTGAFSIDVSSVAANVPGEWRLGILDAQNSYAPYGPQWPSPPIYNGLEVQHLVVTDTVYFWASEPAHTDGKFWINSSNTGKKMYRLVDTASGNVLAEYIKQSGLIRSYQYAPGEVGYGTGMEDRNFVYDQALAIFAALASGNQSQAKLYTDGMLLMQTMSGTHQGGFVFAAPQLSPSYTDPLYRTGAHAIATDALLAYIDTFPNDPNIAAYKARASEALSFIQAAYSGSGATSGLYLGGYGTYSGNPQVFDPNSTITWASTEHNMDIWHAYKRAERIFPNAGYAAKAKSLQQAMTEKLYNASEQRYNQGVNGGVPDPADPLDVNTWGAIQLYATNQISAANAAMDRLSPFVFTRGGVTGYAPFYDSQYYPGAVPTVWFEGSFGTALAYYKIGRYDEYRATLDNLIAGQQGDGSFRYATDTDAQYEIGSMKSVAGTAWYVLATTGRDTIWNTCEYVEHPVVPNPVLPADPAGNISGKNKQIVFPYIDRHYVPESALSEPAMDIAPTPERTKSSSEAGAGRSNNSLEPAAQNSPIKDGGAWWTSPWAWGVGAGTLIAGGSLWWLLLLARRRKSNSDSLYPPFIY